MRFLLRTAAMTIAMSKATGLVSLLDDKHNPLFGEADAGRRMLGYAQHPDGTVQQRFSLEGGQAIYGLGQHQAGLLDYRGTTVRLQ